MFRPAICAASCGRTATARRTWQADPPRGKVTVKRGNSELTCTTCRPHGTLGRCCYAFGYELRAGPAGAETAGSGTGRQLQTSRAGDGCGNWWHGNWWHARAAHTWRFCRASQARVGRPTGTHTRGHVRRRAPYDAVLGDEVDCGAGRDGPHLQVQALVPVSAPVDNRCVLRRAPNLWILRVCDLTCHVGCPLRRRTGIEYEPQNDFKPPSATEIADYAK